MHGYIWRGPILDIFAVQVVLSGKTKTIYIGQLDSHENKELVNSVFVACSTVVANRPGTWDRCIHSAFPASTCFYGFR